MSYKISELWLNDETPEEQYRVRKIFLDIKKKCLNNEAITEHEKEFFALCLKTSLLDDGNIYDYPCLENSVYRKTYLRYWFDLTGASKYEKTHKKKIVPIPRDEVERDLKYLIEEAKKWNIVIKKTNHNSELLQQVSKETREQIKTLNNLPVFKNDIVLQGSFYFRYKLWSILLVSKYVYLAALEIIEKIIEDTNDFPYILKLKSKEIEFNEYSLVHIMLRHFAEQAKNFKSDKSHHSKDFNPRYLTIDLHNIFKRIEPHLNTLKNNIVFEFRSQLYEIWFQEKTKSVKGLGNKKYNRFETFYPIKDQKRVNEITENLTKALVDEELILYQ